MQDRLGDKVRLSHIIDALNEVDVYIKDMDLVAFCANSLVFNATLRQLEVVGEASNRLSDSLLKSNTEVPWAKIVGLRNLIIHEYFSVEPTLIWKILQNNIPEFKAQILRILENDFSN
jgi:uncharacterized protein with HEPN domain